MTPDLVAILMDRIEHLEEQVRFVKFVSIMAILVIIGSLALGMYMGSRAIEITPGPPQRIEKYRPSELLRPSLQASLR